MNKDNQKRCLVIDDERDFAKYVEDVAADHGYLTKIVASGLVAKDAFGEFKPDVIILDMVMPDMDGIETMEWLADADYQGRLILVTGFNPRYSEMGKSIGEVRGLKIDAILQKPVRLHDLVKYLN